MKAEEISQWVLDNRYKNEPERMTDAEMYNLLTNKIKDIIKIKCKEQRKICFNNIEYSIIRYDDDEDVIADENSIINAPEPEL